MRCLPRHTQDNRRPVAGSRTYILTYVKYISALSFLFPEVGARIEAFLARPVTLAHVAAQA